MAGDKYSAIWVSHSSMGDFLKCPRLYYLNNVYKDPSSGHKISLMSPPLALGQAVHEVVESLSVIPVEERFKEPLSVIFERAWKKVEGKRGGFFSDEVEKEYKARGKEMLGRVMNDPGPLKKKAVKIRMELPHFWLSEEENIILCGKVDWLEYLEETDGVHIIDFKTGRREEKKDSLQLPIYLLLVENCQKRKVERASYWYLGRDDGFVGVELPDREKAKEEVMTLAKRIKLLRKLGKLECKEGSGGCRYCRDHEAVLNGRAELVGLSEFNQDLYVLASGMAGGSEII